MATILIIDPNNLRLEAQEAVIRTMGHNPVTAGSGADAIAALSEHPETSLLLCNLEIPDGTFEDFVKAVRSTPHYAILPFVMLAEECEPSRLMNLISSGIEGMIKLPMSAELLTTTVQKGIDIYAQRHFAEGRSA
ncbi:MAG: CheY-like chemotaxis protein [Planctomycetota bacterium]|jgi:CheY-like chemotaxis protein